MASAFGITKQAHDGASFATQPLAGDAALRRRLVEPSPAPRHNRFTVAFAPIGCASDLRGDAADPYATGF